MMYMMQKNVKSVKSCYSNRFQNMLKEYQLSFYLSIINKI